MACLVCLKLSYIKIVRVTTNWILLALFFVVVVVVVAVSSWISVMVHSDKASPPQETL